MEKKKFLISLITNNSKEEYNLLGNYDSINKIIYYNENKDKVTTMEIDLKNKTLTRENKDIYVKYSFVEKMKTNAIIKIKETNNFLETFIITDKLVITNNSVCITYRLLDSNQVITYEIKF